MLRALVVLLFVANVLALAWHQGWIAPGAAPVSRLSLQVHPEKMKLLGQQAVTQLATQACVDIGPLDGEEALRKATAALTKAGLSNSAWQAQTATVGGSWALATIKMPSKDFQARKEETYRSARIAFEPLVGLPDEQPTLVLSRHDSEAAAQAALDGMTRRNYKGLRVLALQAPRQQTTLRLPNIDGLQLSKLDAIANPPWGGARNSCEVATAAGASAPASAPASGAAGASAAAKAASR
jgi:hypothetical protein